MATIEEVKKALEDYLAVRCTDTTKVTYLQRFNRILAISPSLVQNIQQPSGIEVMAVLAELKRQGFEPATLRSYHYFLKSLCKRCMRGNWPLGAQDIPPLPAEQRQPTMATELIMRMVERMKDCPDLAARTRFAISTTYGARRIELGDLDKNTIDLERGVIRIKTRKHGDIRTHIIPNEIKPHLYPDKLVPLDAWQMSELFKRIEEYCGFKHYANFGWHSIRRRLATWLDDRDVSESDIFKFMRWKRRRTILDTYIVRTAMETDKKLAEVDQRIFKIHPFLPIWAAPRGDTPPSPSPSSSPASPA